MSWAEILQRKVTRREAIELGGKAAVGLALAACTPASTQSERLSSPQSTLKVDASSQYEVPDDSKESDLVIALKKHSMTVGQLLIFDGSLEKLQPYFTPEVQAHLSDPSYRASFQRNIKPYSLCGSQEINLREGSVTENQGAKFVSVLFSKACNSRIEVTVPSYPSPVTTSGPLTLTQIQFVYQKIDGRSWKISAVL